MIVNIRVNEPLNHVDILIKLPHLINSLRHTTYRQQSVSPSLFIQGGAQSVLNDLYCSLLLIELQLKFPSSQSDRQVPTHTVTTLRSTFHTACLFFLCDVFQHTHAHMAPLKHEIPSHARSASGSHINNCPGSSSVAVFYCKPFNLSHYSPGAVIVYSYTTNTL